MANTPPDPAAFFRDMLGQWEKTVNEVGGGFMKSEEFARTMGGATAASSQAQAATHGMMERALAAANMPSRAEIEDLSARLARMEGQLARIEAKLDGTAAPAPRQAATHPHPQAADRGVTPPRT